MFNSQLSFKIIFETAGWFLLVPTYIIFDIYSIIPTYVCSAPGILMALIISIFRWKGNGS